MTFPRASLAALLLAATVSSAAAADITVVSPTSLRLIETWTGRTVPATTFSYTVKSNGTGVPFTVTGIPTWLSVSPTTGIATSTGVTITVKLKTATVKALGPGTRTARLAITAKAKPSNRIVRSVRLDRFSDPFFGFTVVRRDCIGCHDGMGSAPSLKGAYGRKAGTDPIFDDYSDELVAWGKRWNYDRLWRWTRDPETLVPGADMPSFTSLTSAERHAVISYIRSQK